MACDMNCQNCDHMKNNPDNGYCYMFRNEPDGICRQFKSATTEDGFVGLMKILTTQK